MNLSTHEFDAVERSLSEFFDEVRTTEVAPPNTWERVTSRMVPGDLGARVVTSGGRRSFPRSLAAGAVATSLALVAFLVLNGSSGDGVASAHEILQRAERTATSPQTAGVNRLVVEQRIVGYFLGEEARGVPYAEATGRVWYEAPDRQRVESSLVELDANGDFLSETISVAVWDGVEQWIYDSGEQTATVRRQDPNADIYEQGILSGALARSETFLSGSHCREAEVVGEADILGRTTDVLELSPAACGFTLSGSDGRAVIWVDRETGFVLRAERYAADGGLASLQEVTSLEINTPIADEQWRFAPPPGVEVQDRREDPVGMGAMTRIEPRLLSIEDAIALATFAVRLPSNLPDGFELKSAELWWPGVGIQERPTVANDWVLVRYADEEGNWLQISQGFGGMLPGLASIAPAEVDRGTRMVRGAEAEWIDGQPLMGGRWESGTMRILVIDAGRVGSGWAIGPDGERLTGSPLHIALASNLLSVDELVEVAEGLE